MNTDTIDALGIITIDYGKSLEDLIAAGKYDWVNPNITADKFPVEGTGTKKFRTKLFDFGRYISSEDAVMGRNENPRQPKQIFDGRTEIRQRVKSVGRP